jgi:hypothetical protein
MVSLHSLVFAQERFTISRKFLALQDSTDSLEKLGDLEPRLQLSLLKRFLFSRRYLKLFLSPLSFHSRCSFWSSKSSLSRTNICHVQSDTRLPAICCSPRLRYLAFDSLFSCRFQVSLTRGLGNCDKKDKQTFLCRPCIHESILVEMTNRFSADEIVLQRDFVVTLYVGRCLLSS